MSKSIILPCLLIALALAGVTSVHAQNAKPTPAPSATPAAAPLHAELSEKTDGKPATTFGTDLPGICLNYQGDALKNGDKLKAVWTIEDAGKKIKKNTQVYEQTKVANSKHSSGSFTLGKPAAGWPTGKYRADIFVNDAKAVSLEFTIK